MASLFSFPRTVNDVSARLVASGVIAQALLWQVTRWPILLATLTFGFAARVATGPRLSPLGQFVTRIATPRLTAQFGWAEKIVAGPPKRFAQAVGLMFTGGASLAWFVGAPTLAIALLAGLIAAASLEAVFGFCLGCKVFGVLMKLGIIPDDVCAECNDLSAYWARRQPASRLSA
jgi:Domain of unknown function (DUF4395)